ncbi:DUF4153 domain-containing protein [Caulobacter sp. UNC279MFTsu5.1]|uniref:DUF4153 domain-containing protein n=1 Tax=Caulobacter sp. UNC279MFTsu5.1 TaxID=1502775 RepID=UPI0008E460BF|nr:DUF4153 domain-containing protein [Caulobacter sp. UNC279MFTsu5.1]SFK16429.1 protein of unknown function [Caulobacter sp. UNC279MFTsu5.1]
MTDAQNETAPSDPRAIRRATIIRLATGLAQGLLLYGLYQADKSKVWPATQRELYAALLLAFIFAPFVVLAGVSALRWRTLAIWKGVAALVAAGLGAYGVWSGDPAATGVNGLGPQTFLGVAALVFIGHHLVQPADMERRWIARFATYFDVTWKHGVQGVLSAGFTGAFWLLLFLASALFKLIGVDAIEKLIQREWFIFPATAVMFAAAVQLTDVRSALVRGVRTVALTLLAWLLPLMALIAAAFLLTLPFTGLEPLWKTKSATAILLVADAFLILLTNAAYQDGTEKTAVVLKWAARLAGVLLVPITVLAAYGLSLRIGQYGLSPDRIIVAACVLVAAGHAVGYAVAAVRPGAWMKTLEATNIAMAFVVIAVLLALFTPVADPRRLSVENQVARLEKGKVKAMDFDFRFLRFDAGRYGQKAFEAMKHSPRADVREGAKIAALLKSRYDRPWEDRPARTQDKTNRKILAKLEMLPAGAVLPQEFAAQFTAPGAIPLGYCSDSDDAWCIGTLRQIDGAGAPELLLSDGREIVIYRKAVTGKWEEYAVADLSNCPTFNIRDVFAGGRLKALPPSLPDLEIAGERYHLTLGPMGCEQKDPPPAVLAPPPKGVKP